MAQVVNGTGDFAPLGVVEVDRLLTRRQLSIRTAFANLQLSRSEK